MVEPLAVGVHAATKAQVKPGDIALVMGAGPIGLVTALSALAAGCARVFVTDIDDSKLELAASLARSRRSTSRGRTRHGKSSPPPMAGASTSCSRLRQPARRGRACSTRCARPAAWCSSASQSTTINYDVGKAMVREARVEHVFRYAHVFPRCVAMLSSGAIDVKPLITRDIRFRRQRSRVRDRRIRAYGRSEDADCTAAMRRPQWPRSQSGTS